MAKEKAQETSDFEMISFISLCRHLLDFCDPTCHFKLSHNSNILFASPRGSDELPCLYLHIKRLHRVLTD